MTNIGCYLLWWGWHLFPSGNSEHIWWCEMKNYTILVHILFFPQKQTQEGLFQGMPRMASANYQQITVQPIKFSELMLSDTLLCTSKNYLAVAGKRRKTSYSGDISLEWTVQVSPSVVNFFKINYRMCRWMNTSEIVNCNWSVNDLLQLKYKRDSLTHSG